MCVLVTVYISVHVQYVHYEHVHYEHVQYRGETANIGQRVIGETLKNSCSLRPVQGLHSCPLVSRLGTITVITVMHFYFKKQYLLMIICG